MKILLTGSTGMVGKNILEHSDSNQFEFLCPFRDELDLTNYDDIVVYYAQHLPDIIIHAAGKVGGIQANIRNPVEFLADNLQMGLNVILSAERAGIRKLINLSSSCVYPRDALNPLKENSVLTGELEPTNEGYALAKIVTQKLCEYINKERSEFNYKTLIPCNLYGRYDNFNSSNSHLIPAIIKKIDLAIEKKSNVEIWGDGSARREFMYTGDLADAIYFIIHNYDMIPSVMNIGLGFDHSIEEYYKAIANVMKYKGKFIYNLDKPIGMNQKLVDVEKQNRLEWKPKFSLEDGLKKTLEYYYKKIK